MARGAAAPAFCTRESNEEEEEEEEEEVAARVRRTGLSARV